jgi:hypothetical protein
LLGGRSISRPPLNVLITVDTEFSPRDFHAGNGEIRALIARDVDGITAEGSFGIGFQMDLLEKHGLRANFQVESLSASAFGPEQLERIVSDVQKRGHEVQMHVHAEWLEAISDPELPPFRGRNLVSYTEDEQTRIVGRGLRNIRAAGAARVCAFRAGNYGANRDTLRAVARNGLRFDTSYNVCYLDPTLAAGGSGLLIQPGTIDGVVELPISFFEDWPGHYRPAQLCACSHREMEHALVAAWEAGWNAFVIVSHSFELIKRPKDPMGPAHADRLVIGRMENLCRFLANNRERFRAVVFSELDPAAIAPLPGAKPLRSRMGLTAGRMVEQLLGRIR